ncbi:MAG: ATP-binding protein [Nitrospinae bacterium]|nr:ATP-binding protein [Nitrospinota bacterium]
MLLRFAVENHLSICERQELSFAASSLKDQSDGLIRCEAVDSGAVVPAVVIYGANASGKTNFVNALSTMRLMVLWSQTKGEPGGGVPRQEFLLDPSFSEKPSCFEIDFVLDGIRYHYGFEATDEAFTSEWLYEIPKAHRRRLYERKKLDFDFGRRLKGQNHNIARLTRSNSLFLSAAAQNGHELLSRVYKYFQDIAFSGPIPVPGVESSSRVKGDRVDDRVIEFLKSINTGVIGYQKRETELSEDDRANHRELRAVLERISGGAIELKPLDEEKMVRIELAHRGRGGEVVHFDLGLESAGTLRMLNILSQTFEAIDEGLPIIIDELDASLHTYASEAILRLFCSSTVNQNGAQLIATTHDTNLMKSPILRRDQLWFADKNNEGATEIYPLTDIRTRKGDNVELGYLQGRYGAVPSDDPVAALLQSH